MKADFCHITKVCLFFCSLGYLRATMYLVLAESVWVLNKVSKFAKMDISGKLMKLVEFEGINTPDKNVILAALEMYQRYNVDYSDAYLAAKAEIMGNAEVITYNRKDFNKMGVNNGTPANISV